MVDEYCRRQSKYVGRFLKAIKDGHMEGDLCKNTTAIHAKDCACHDGKKCNGDCELIIHTEEGPLVLLQDGTLHPKSVP